MTLQNSCVIYFIVDNNIDWNTTHNLMGWSGNFEDVVYSLNILPIKVMILL